MRCLPIVAAFIIALTLAAGPGLAADGRPSTEDLVNRLTKPDALTRGFTPGGRGITVVGPEQEEAPPSVDLDINFEFNSAKLTTDAMLTLDNLGTALKDPKLEASRFQVAGHTDSVGGDAFNMTLSAKRARAVRDYLVERHGVQRDRVESVGYGESQLLDKEHPDAAVNRRVQITNLGG